MSTADIAHSQPSILAKVPPAGCSLTFRLAPDGDCRSALLRLREDFALDAGVVGVGDPAVRALEKQVTGLSTFPALSGPAFGVPSTQQALSVFLRGDDRGVLFDASVKIRSILDQGFELHDLMDTFVYAGGRDLTGYEDGTENPRDDKAAEAALVSGASGLSGSSFVAVQRWVHDLKHFNRYPGHQRDAMIGRRQDTNEELTEAPPSAHVKRTAQESYVPPAFMVRRSMPWAGVHEQGLEFIAYVKSLDRYERVLRRMVGLEDGIADALFKFSRPVTGGYYWCPPVQGGKLDFSCLGV